MTKKVFTGEKQNLPRLARDVEDWLQQQGFEVQSAGGDGTFLVQARKKSTLRSLLGNNQTIDVKIEGTPENYSIDVDAGQWMKNLADSGGAGIVAALATMYTLGIAAAWSASERSKIETGLWAQKDASCPACIRIGAAVGTGEKFVRAEGITLQPSGMYQGTKVFTDTFKCRLCSHTWDRGEKPRQVSLCPTCYDETPPRRTGEKAIICKKTDKRSQSGQPLGEQVFRETFQCTACSHSWESAEKTRMVEICPACLKTGTREATGEHIFAVKKTDQTSPQGQTQTEQTFTNTFRCKACAHQWNDGQKTRLVGVQGEPGPTTGDVASQVKAEVTATVQETPKIADAPPPLQFVPPTWPAAEGNKDTEIAESYLRTKDYKRAEASFSSLLDGDPGCARAWVGKAWAIGFQTWAGSPDGIIKNYACADRSEAALLCLGEARRVAKSDEERVRIEEVNKRIITFTIKTLFDAASAVYQAMSAHRASGLIFTKVGPAAQIQSNFVRAKAVPMLARCHQLDPQNKAVLKLLAECLEFCGQDASRVRAALNG